jgi:hypothetical protein
MKNRPSIISSYERNAGYEHAPLIWPDAEKNMLTATPRLARLPRSSDSTRSKVDGVIFMSLQVFKTCSPRRRIIPRSSREKSGNIREAAKLLLNVLYNSLECRCRPLLASDF